MKYEGKKQFKVQHEWHDDMMCIVEIDFDFPNIMQSIQQQVEFWYGWEQKLKRNDGDYVKTFLQQLGSHVQDIALGTGYNTWGVKEEFNSREGWAPMNGLAGINILHHTRLEFEDQEFEVTETSGWVEKKHPLFS